MKTQTDTYIKINGINVHKPGQNNVFNINIKFVENLLIELNSNKMFIFSYTCCYKYQNITLLNNV